MGIKILCQALNIYFENSKNCPTQRIAVPGREGKRRLEVVELLGSAGQFLAVVGMSQADEQLGTLTDGGTAEIGNAVFGDDILDVVALMGDNGAGSGVPGLQDGWYDDRADQSV